jgi:hypothetical protein
MDCQNYLTATIKVPVKINAEGELIVLDNYAEISIEPLTSEPRETFDSIYEKIIEYVQQNPGYLTCIVDEGVNQKHESEDPDEGLGEHIMHTFPYFKRSKKPLNTSFRHKGTKHNFTKKNYENN